MAGRFGQSVCETCRALLIGRRLEEIAEERRIEIKRGLSSGVFHSLGILRIVELRTPNRRRANPASCFSFRLSSW
jgi:nitrogenase molybdenum-iron protein alpha/beta subunit